MEEVIIYKYQLEAIKEALRVVSRTHSSQLQITCMDRMVVESQKYVQNALDGKPNTRVKYGIKE